MDVVYERDERVSSIVYEYRHHLSHLNLEEMCFTEDTFSQTLKLLADTLFGMRGATKAYIITFLAFCKNLDKFCSVQYEWYNSNMLVDNIVYILSRTDFDPTFGDVKLQNYCNII